MATLIRMDGSQEILSPAKSHFELDELYRLLSCTTVQGLPLGGRRWLVMDEDGKYTTKGRNDRATEIAQTAGLAWYDFVVGDVLIVRQTPKGEWK